MPTLLALQVGDGRMCSCANSSKQPGCTPASTVIGTPASRLRDDPWRELETEIDLAACERLRNGSTVLHGDIADVGEPFRAQQVLGDVRPQARNRDQLRFRGHAVAGSWSPPAAPRRRAIPGCRRTPAARGQRRLARKSRRVCMILHLKPPCSVSVRGSRAPPGLAHAFSSRLSSFEKTPVGAVGDELRSGST